MFLLYSPLNQGLKRGIKWKDFFFILSVFTLQSIKSRIETPKDGLIEIECLGFLLYSPLNQGLKLCHLHR